MLQKLLQFVLIAFLAVDLIAIVFLVYLTVGSRGAMNPPNQEILIFTIEKGQSAREIARGLEQIGLISNDLFFSYYLWSDRSANVLQAGEYALSPSMTIPEIVRKFKTGEVREDFGAKITIPEGYTTSQIEATLIGAGLKINESELVEAAGISAPLAHEIFGFGFLLDLPSRATLDGFLFPDTYFFDEEAQLNEVVGRMLANFSEKISESLRVKIKARGKNLYEIVIMASLIEREVRTSEDMRLVSGVLWRRMEIGMVLQVDATLLYITGNKAGQISNDDKLIDSAYNTYKYRGLPPTPIANPGLRAIKAAADPVESDYLYYLSTPTGETIFSETLDKHNENRAKYLQ